MGDYYPTEEEEFELMYADELELLNEQEDLNGRPARRSLNFTKPSTSQVQNVRKDLYNTFEADFVPLTNKSKSSVTVQTIDPIPGPSNASDSQDRSNKRSLDELFGDIDDILRDGVCAEFIPKKAKYSDRETAELALIGQIVALRKASREKHDPSSKFGKDYTTVDRSNRENISKNIPKYPFVTVVNNQGERLYIRCHSEEFRKEERERMVQKCSFSGIMGSTFKDIWKEATQLINNSLEDNQVSQNAIEEVVLDPTVAENKNLWVDLYKPRKYYELLSDESSNRNMLKWLKLWDKAVFNRRPKVKLPKPEVNKGKFKFQRQELTLELDPDGRPHFKVALLCGPPGLGKTTLAHMVAKHCGYNVVEINASDDRSTQNFETALENATSMRSVLDQEKRPNCLVFDEIDGAPSTSIDYLIKFINGTHAPKTKKAKNHKPQVLKRPIICICNDVYVPALRNLRQVAFVVNLPPTSSARLAERLAEIARHQGIKTDMGALMALADKTNNDIRSCLSILHFFKMQDKPVTLSDVWKTSIGQKDMQKGLFSVWEEIFRISRPKTNNQSDYKDMSTKSRVKKVLQTVQSFGDYDRVMQGVFENYPGMHVKDSTLIGICEASEWFCFNDLINREITTKQDYSLMAYLPFGFAIWHMVFASLNWQKITYPNVGYEVRTKAQKVQGLVNEVLKGMPPTIRAYVHPVSLKLEILPHLTKIIVPPFRPVNLHLYTQEEKKLLNRVVNIMIDYGLNYVQERNVEGSYIYNLDPNVNDIVMFSGSKSARALSYSNKQMIAQEIHVEKMRRVETHKKMSDPGNSSGRAVKKDAVPNHLHRLQPKTMKPKEAVVTKDFFGRVIVKDPAKEKAKKTFTHDVWFTYNEGHTNAVRRPVKIKVLK